MAAVAFAMGAIVGANHSGSFADGLAAQFTAAWARGDYARMYTDIDVRSQGTLSASGLARAYVQASTVATATRLEVAGGPYDSAGGVVVVPVRVHTRLFGTLASSFRLPISGQGSRARVTWSRSLLFPGLRPGELLARHTTLPPRAALLARDGSILADGVALAAGQRNSPLGVVASAAVGTVGPIPVLRLGELKAEGVPSDAIVGVSGLERGLDDRLRGSPGGVLLAGQRVLATAIAHAAPAVRTTISPAIQRTAVTALGGQFGGIIAMQPTTGEILAVAGIGLNDLQPPGSTFKMVTLTSVLEAGLARPESTFPYRSSTTLDGVRLENANGESCGGSLALAFAVSCNSVFAPLGVKLGATRLVRTAEGFGFNHDPGIQGAAESTLPPPSKIEGELAVGSTAIGQGQVQASVLEMAIVAATIADRGQRPQPTLTLGSPAPRVPAVSPTVAHTVRRLMIGVVRSGTGTAAAIPGVVVAGKTGTAELGTTPCPGGSQSTPEAGSGSEAASSLRSSQESCPSAAKNPQNTDAWFAAFAPALHPRIVVGVLLVRDGAGGETAAPVARQVLEAGLQARS